MPKPHPNRHSCEFSSNDFSWSLLSPPHYWFSTNSHWLVLLFCLILPAASLAAPLAAPITPEKDITVVNNQAEVPLWKKWWDDARNLSQEQSYEKAIERYLAVLEEKPQIEEVKWELCKVLIATEDYERASVLLAGLLETDANRIEYLISAGDIALLEKKSDQAVHYFGQAFEQDPGGPYSDEALWGLIKSLKKQGKGSVALPLMEQLYQRGQVNPELLLDLARQSREHALLDKAHHYYSDLITKYRVEPSVLIEAAIIIEQAGSIKKAVTLWKQYLAAQPGYLPFHRKLADYFLEQGESLEALPHLIVLLDNGVDRQQNLLLVANIYLLSLGRVDKSLFYFEQYKKDFPSGVDVSSEIANIQVILANDLLSIIENSGVWMLWRDLARITPDRIGIYRAMAKLLEELHRNDELIEVLQIIIVHDPEDIETRIKLSSLYLKRKSYEECILFLDNGRQNKNLTASYYLLQSQCQQGLKNDLGVIAAYQNYLTLQPLDDSVRTNAIKLAGDLGLIDILKKLYEGRNKASAPGAPTDLELEYVYFDNLKANQLYTEAELLLDSILIKGDENHANQLRYTLEKSNLYFESGKLFEAERLLRQSLVNNNDSLDVIILLAEQALQKRDKEGAAAWLTLGEYLNRNIAENNLNSTRKSKLFLQGIKYDRLIGEVKNSWNKAAEYLKTRKGRQQLVDLDVDILIFLAKEYYTTGNYDKAFELLIYYKNLFGGSKKIPLFLTIVELKSRGGQPSNNSDGGKEVSKINSLSERLDLAELMITLDDAVGGLKIIEKIKPLLSSSVRVRVLTAQASLNILDYQTTWENYHVLHVAYPDQSYFQEQLFRIEYLQGKSANIIDTSVVVGKKTVSEGGYDSLVRKLFQARALWSEDLWSEALEIYDEVYFQLKDRLSLSMSELEEIPEYRDFLSRSFWGDILFSPDDNEILDMLMAPAYFSERRDTEVARITADMYASYRWHKIVKLERDAKNALNAKEFYQAERDYQELIDVNEDAGEEVYPDLATIYSRLGKNREEAELLEKIKEMKMDYPVLEEAEEQNVRQRQPHLSIDGEYRKEDGRKGFIDITRKYLGMSLNLMPSLSQEAGVWYGRNEYGNSEASTLAKSNLILGQYKIHFNKFLEGEAALGFEDFDTDGKSFLIYDLLLEATLAKGISIYATGKQEPVDDTIYSLADGIYRRDFGAGLNMEFLTSFFLGFDFSLLNYSDENDGKHFNLWGSYRLFSERSSFDFTYRYEKFENKITNGDYWESGLESDTNQLNYWSPGNYWKHLVSAEYKLELWPTGRLQSGTSYVSAHYGLGYEQGNNFIETLELNILLELSPIFLVKGTLASQWSGDYQFQEAFVSLAYRW